MEARIPYESCPLCESHDLAEEHVATCLSYPLYKPELPPLMRWLRCRACDHVFVDGYFGQEALRILFSESHQGQTPGDDIEVSRYVSARIVENVGLLRPGIGGRWLDVGFGNGSLLTTAAELGWDVVGIDLRDDNVRRLRALGIEAFTTELTNFEPNAPFDVISMADVLEHIPFPKPALKQAHRLLREGGFLFVSMPNSDSVLWETLNKNGVNPYWAELEHYHNFGRKRLEKLLEECGFAPKRYGVSVRYRACMEVIAQKVEAPLANTKKPSSFASGASDLRLNLGCGRSPIPGWINVDSMLLPGVDVVADLEKANLPFEDNSVSEFAASHVLEHIHNALGLMQELHRIAKPGAIAIIRVPYGSSDDADTDPTHVRRYYWGSWGYFGQPYYWRADYGYRGDWEIEDIVLTVEQEYKGKSWAEVFQAVKERRNVVKEMVATLRAVKPVRAALRELQRTPTVRMVTSE